MEPNPASPKAKFHAVIFKCEVCESWHDAKKNKAIAVTKLVGFSNPGQKVSHGIYTQGATVCEKCFKELELPENEIKIARAGINPNVIKDVMKK